MPIKLSLPGWLATLIAGLAAYLRGALDQRARDEKAAADADAEKTAEEKRAEAEAMDHDALQQEESRWTAP